MDDRRFSRIVSRSIFSRPSGTKFVNPWFSHTLSGLGDFCPKLSPDNVFRAGYALAGLQPNLLFILYDLTKVVPGYKAKT
jgi:hypothetical protein